MTVSEWLSQVKNYLVSTWGLDKSFAEMVAPFIYYLYYYRLSPVITSGYRDPAKQQELLERYNAGDTSVVAKPAVNSKHCVTKWGRPAAQAIDISTSNKSFAAEIARQLKIGAGYYFSSPDPVHFYI